VELSYNLFAEKELIHEPGGVRLPFDDAAQEDLWLRIDREIGFRPSFFFFEKVARFLARENTFHPVRDYLTSLKWDGEPRINTWLVEYGGAKDEPPEGAPRRSEYDDSLSYLESVSSLTLMAAVKRALEPGCKYDEMLVLESSQGLNKSTGVRALCPDETWFSDDLSLNSKSKELIEHTLGKWIIEASDLSGKKKTEIEQLKAMMSRQVDGPARMSYAHKAVERPRHFILIGTTNSRAYLTDSTGARRFWPVRVQLFDIDALVRDRDQLWAEAVVRVRNGESIRMPPELWIEAAQHQEARREIDPWEATLQHTLDMIKASGDGKRRVTAEALFLAVGLVDIARRDRPAQLRVSAIMQRLGFTRRNVWDGEQTVTGYIEETASALAVDPDDTRTR
jgi:predicted P-loop ATPase